MAGLLGQELFQPPDVKGWDGGAAWITSSTCLARGNLAGYLVEGLSPRRLVEDLGRAFRPLARARYRPQARLRTWITGARDAETVVDTLCDRLLAVPVTEQARQSLIALLGRARNGTGFDLPSEVRLRRLARVILSLPEAQLG